MMGGFDVTYKLNANGVHLGQSNEHTPKAHQTLGENKIIGLTIERKERVDVESIVHRLYWSEFHFSHR